MLIALLLTTGSLTGSHTINPAPSLMPDAGPFAKHGSALGNPLWFECRPGTGPCNPQPSWPVTYRMNESVQLMGLGISTANSATAPPVDGVRGTVPVGYPAARWAIFDIDWGTGIEVWAKAKPQNCSEMMVKQIEDMGERCWRRRWWWWWCCCCCCC